MKPYLYKSYNHIVNSHWEYSLYLFAKYVKDLYVAIGKDTPWNLEDNPPSNFEHYSQYLEELSIYKPIDKISLINESECGTFFFNNKNWHKLEIFNRRGVELLDNRLSLSLDRKYEALLLEVEIDINFLPINSYRIKALFSDLTPRNDSEFNTNKDFYLKNEFINEGVLHWLNFSMPVTNLSKSNIVRILLK